MSKKDSVTRASNTLNAVQRAKRFADALAEFRQYIGWMRRLQDAMAKESQASEQYHYRHDGEDDAHLIDKAERTVGQLEEAWPQVCQAHKRVRATVFVPAFPVGGVEPNQWAHGVLAEVSELTELVGGAYASTPRMGMTADQVERYYVLLNRLGVHVRYLEELATMADAMEVREKDGQLRMLMQDEDAPGKETSDGERDEIGFASARELANRWGLSNGAARKRLDRWREKNPMSKGYTENVNRARHEPQYLYDPKAVGFILDKPTRTTK